jgi:glutathione S-transferase
MPAPLTLISHALCPYVQRAAIVLAEKGVPFERIDIDLSAKPDWFLAVSPLGKTPVLRVGGTPVFESAAICEYLDETLPPRLHPADALARAQHRGWMAFGSALLDEIGAFYTAPDEAALADRAQRIGARFEQLERRLQAKERNGPWFDGDAFSIVDAVFGPVFRYFDVFDTLADFGWMHDTPAVRAWRARLAARPSVRDAARADYPALLRAFLIARGGALSRRIREADAGVAATPAAARAATTGIAAASRVPSAARA